MKRSDDPATGTSRTRPLDAIDARLEIARPAPPASVPTLADDVRAGLGRRPYQLPPRYFYDAVGAELFDRICDTPEYYPTRTEAHLLERVAPEVIGFTGARELVELGSGAARKTRLLIEAALAAHGELLYRPVDLSEEMLVQSARALLTDYPSLRVGAVLGDYDRDVPVAVPGGPPRIVAFLGSTIGNLDVDESIAFLGRLANRLGPRDHLLLGVDLIKDHAMLNAAYNDAQGLTAAFNRNVLVVLNRELHAHFEPQRFEHIAFYNAAAARIEMHLRATDDHTVAIDALGMTVPFVRGETIHTEISRKFSRESASEMLSAAGMEPQRWWDERGLFGLVLARAKR